MKLSSEIRKLAASIGESRFAAEGFLTKVKTWGYCEYWPTIDAEDPDNAGGDELPGQVKPDLGDLQKAIDSSYKDLSEYIHSDLKDKIIKIQTPRAFSSGDEFMLIWRVYSNSPLDDKDQNELLRFIEGQCSDGWGEGFEQRPYKNTPTGGFYAHLWGTHKKPEIGYIQK